MRGHTRSSHVGLSQGLPVELCLCWAGGGCSGPQEERVELCRVGEAVRAILTSQDLCSLLVGGCGLRGQSVNLSAGQAWVWPEETSG